VELLRWNTKAIWKVGLGRVVVTQLGKKSIHMVFVRDVGLLMENPQEL